MGDALWYVGIDDRGLQLEIIAVPDDTGLTDLAIIHVMPTSFRRGDDQ